MTWYHAGGLGFNHLARINDAANGAPSQVMIDPPGDDANPDSRIRDNRPGTAYQGDEGRGYLEKWQAQVDKNLVVNGDCNDTTTGWSVSGATSVPYLYGRGGKQIQLAAGGYIQQDITVRADELLNFTFADADSGKVYATLLEPDYYLKSDGTWQAGALTAARTFSSAGAWETTTISAIVVPSVAVLGGPTATLRVRVETSSSGAVDDAFLWPSTSYIALIGHNFPNWATLTVTAADASDNTGNRTTLVSLGAVTSPNWGLQFTVNHQRYWLIIASLNVKADSNYNPYPGVGEFILTQVTALSRKPDGGVEVTFSDRGQIRYENRSGGRWVYSALAHPLRQVVLNFRVFSLAQESEAIQNFKAWMGGKYPVLLLPDAGPPEFTMPLYGTVTDEMVLTWPRVSTVFAQHSFTVREEPPPIF